jgi:hypothetical protein
MDIVAAMITPTNRTALSLTRPFRLRAVDRVLPPRTYEVVTEEELIEGLSWPVCRRKPIIISTPGLSASAGETMTIDPINFAAAQGLDGSPTLEAP